MDKLNTEALLKLYPDYDRVYAGRVNSDNRRVVCLYKTGVQKRTSISYAKALMEVHLGKRIEKSYEVDHKDNDKFNDTIDNLQVITAEENRVKRPSQKKENSWRTPVTLTCPQCDCTFTTIAGKVKEAQAKGRSNYCGRSCAVKAAHKK
jgi:hypothetical protein